MEKCGVEYLQSVSDFLMEVSRITHIIQKVD